MQSKVRLGVSQAAYLRPLLYGLDSADSLFDPVMDLPAANSIKLNERTGNMRCAFLSPIDYARHAGPYRIVPGACVSSAVPTGSITLTVKGGVRNITKIAVDVRVTSEIILAKIVLLERLRNVPEKRPEMEFLPMLPDLDAMLNKADAALIVNLSSTKTPARKEFTIDLVDEWLDMTGLPYVNGFWVAREEDLNDEQVKGLIHAKKRGVESLDEVIRTEASGSGVSKDDASEYFGSFGYDFGEDQVNSVSEFISYAFFHGVIGDIPETKFFGSEEES